MLLRNLFQAVVLHPYRAYLGIGLKDVSVNTKMKSDLAYKVLVSQMGGINRSVFFHGYKPILAPVPGYMPLVRLLDKLSLFAHTDEIPRKQSYNAGVGRAYRAIERYRLHGNLGRLIAESGIDYLRPEQQQKFLKYIALGNRGTPVNFGIEGLTDLSGYEAAAIFNGMEVADLANFNYERWMRGEIEHGIVGRLTFNLMTFTRSYWTRIYHDGEMLLDEKAPTRQRIKAFTDVAMVIVMGAVISALLQKLTRRNIKSYWIMDIGWWGTGGLALGGVNDVLETGRLFVEIINPNNTEDERARQLAMFTTAVRRSSEILIPLWVTALQSFEALTGWDGIDRRALDLVRKTLDENYDPKEFENLQLSFIEKLTKSLFNAKPIELNDIDEAIKVLRDKETQLGTIDPDTGYIYTTTQYGSEIRGYIEDIPGDLIDERRGFSPMVVYYRDYLYNLEEFESLSTKGDARKNYRKANLDFEVQLLFWGRYEESLFYLGSKQHRYITNALKMKCIEFGIDPIVAMQIYADWADAQIREK